MWILIRTKYPLLSGNELADIGFLLWRVTVCSHCSSRSVFTVLPLVACLACISEGIRGVHALTDLEMAVGSTSKSNPGDIDVDLWSSTPN